MMRALFSLRIAGAALLLVSFALGVAVAALWLNTTQNWHRHLLTAAHAGETLFDALAVGAVLPEGVVERQVPEAAQALAMAGRFERLAQVPRPALVTHLRLSTSPPERLTSGSVQLAIVSSGLRYPLSELDLSQSRSSRANAPRATLGKVTALIATYCSDAVIFASFSGQPWRRFEGAPVWGCGAVPADNRLITGLLALLALTVLASIAVSSAAFFTDFADHLRARRRVGGADTFRPEGPFELRRIIEAVNEYRDVERQHLAERALVLSGVSHDLGTPATRLKLRAELISDPDLRRKFEADIDQMTGIIESVLTYTRAELSTEEPRPVALVSLVDSVVADYADVGRPVAFESSNTIVLEGGQPIFMSRRGRSEVSEDVQVILQARPIALQRALSNLIDNALKYGRRAIVTLETDPHHAHILIEDEGGQSSIADLEHMTAPFQRGDNATPFEGYGMGLTIASTIAIEHGGGLTFEPGRNGVIARLTLGR